MSYFLYKLEIYYSNVNREYFINQHFNIFIKRKRS